MSIQYEGTAGVRINSDNDNDTDLDVDLTVVGRSVGRLWMGHIGQDHAEKILNKQEVRALRDACARMLIEMGRPKQGEDLKDRCVLALVEADIHA